jgi:hypothetical protein
MNAFLASMVGELKELTDAVAVANGFARANLFASRDERAKFYPDRQWFTLFVGGSYLFMDGGELMLDARNMFFYVATGIHPSDGYG